MAAPADAAMYPAQENGRDRIEGEELSVVT